MKICVVIILYFFIAAACMCRHCKMNYQDPASYYDLYGCPYKGEGINIVIFDKGINIKHPSFASKDEDRLWLPQVKLGLESDCNDKSGHGTMCAGVACGDEVDFMYDGKKVKCRGIAPEATLIVWKRKYKQEWEDQLRSLIKWMKKGKIHVHVVVISSGDEDCSKIPHDCIRTLTEMKTIVVCAGSNEGNKNLTGNVRYPALYKEVICVGSNERHGNRSKFSPVDERMDFLALGEVYGPDSKGGIKLDCGTSFAAPVLGGIIAIIIEALEKCRPDVRCDIMQVLRNLTNQKGTSKVNAKVGYGAIAKDLLQEFIKDPRKFLVSMQT